MTYELPPPGTVRWVASRKQAVVVAVRSGILTMVEACERYRLSIEEILSWDRLFEQGGPNALRATRLRDYRPVR